MATEPSEDCVDSDYGCLFAFSQQEVKYFVKYPTYTHDSSFNANLLQIKILSLHKNVSSNDGGYTDRV